MSVTENDIGIQAVDGLFKALMIDEEWSVREPRGFTWWSYRLAQHVEASEPIWDRGCEISRVRIWTEVANAVDPRRDPATWMAMTNGQQTLSALVWDPAERTVAEHCSAVVHEDNVGWMGTLLATAAVMQNTGAHSRSRAVAEVLGGQPWVSNHPVSGERPEPDNLLDLPKEVLAPAGRGRSQFAGALTEGLEAFLSQFELLGFSDEDGFTCEVPFTGVTPVAMLAALGSPEAKEPPQTCLVRIFPDAEHPQLGHGAQVIMFPPLVFEKDQVPVVANHLNLVEATMNTPTDLLGAWSPNPSNPRGDTIAFNAFLPSALAQPGLLENQILFQAGRSRFFGAAGAEYLRT